MGEPRLETASNDMMVDGGGLDLEGSSAKDYHISISECGDVGCFEIPNGIHVPMLELRCECRTLFSVTLGVVSAASEHR